MAGAGFLQFENIVKALGGARTSHDFASETTA
jgi:hypothetical protein